MVMMRRRGCAGVVAVWRQWCAPVVLVRRLGSAVVMDVWWRSCAAEPLWGCAGDWRV